MNDAPATADPVLRDHYEPEGLAERLLAALNDPSLEVGPALDQFHVGGAQASERLLEKLDAMPGAKVLDLGSGLGGPARLLARARDWDVTGVDLSPAFCRIAQALSGRSGQSDVTRFCAGDALQLPFPDRTFNLVWTEHVAMNIGARDALYRELARVTRPGGRLAVFDVMAGESSAPLTYPLPWARESGQSHLVSPEEFRATVTGAGWSETIWSDETGFARDWLAKARPPKSTAGPTLRQVMGDDFPAMLGNLRDNFAEGRLGAIQAVFTKPA